MKISTGGISIGIGATDKIAAQVAAKSSSGPDPITVEINALSGLYAGRENSDGKYYNIEFPGDYIGERGTAEDPFLAARTGTGPIDYTGTLNVILNIPFGMSIGGNTSGNFGSQTLGGSGTLSGAKYELRSAWDSSWS